HDLGIGAPFDGTRQLGAEEPLHPLRRRLRTVGRAAPDDRVLPRGGQADRQAVAHPSRPTHDRDPHQNDSLGWYTPKTPRSTSQISPSVAETERASRIG